MSYLQMMLNERAQAGLSSFKVEYCLTPGLTVFRAC